jgi:hypothetical protein
MQSVLAERWRNWRGIHHWTIGGQKIALPIVAGKSKSSNMSRTRIFSHQSQKIEMAASAEADGWAVRLFFEDGSRASPIVYRVFYERNVGGKMPSNPGNVIEQLMVLMRSNVERGQIQLTQQSN